ncbi:hypothetical protein BD626DRAFT_236973 [Schizophyllum amplum]|uniref:Uncharacterized protein n=1 Tax=Schizophyllum amplum TaxID=97359 RepID=A0A550CJC7_9AGAR|nr:hypothetical protein BD626DRAFT_236973 [Auriculariopsis ampla]
MHISRTYAENLLLAREGYPLWVPEPLANLPPSYQQSGVRIGDVGVVTKEGAFSMLFNICLPADDPINSYGGVPLEFEHISPGAVQSMPTYFSRSGAYVQSTDIKARKYALEANAETSVAPVGAGCGIEFSLSTAQGAALALPQGATRLDVENLSAFETQINSHGLSWYKYALGDRGWQFNNGELYLITGVDKAALWGALAFRELQRSHSVSFHATAIQQIGLGLRHEYQWHHLTGQSARSGPDARAVLSSDGTPIENQCVFLRGYRIMARDELWRRMSGTGIKVVNFTRPGSFMAPLSSLTHTRPLRTSFKASLTTLSAKDGPFGNESDETSADVDPIREEPYGSEEDVNQLQGGACAEDAVAAQPVLPSEPAFHPSDSINRHILSQGHCNVVFTHDTTWMNTAHRSQMRSPLMRVLRCSWRRIFSS